MTTDLPIEYCDGEYIITPRYMDDDDDDYIDGSFDLYEYDGTRLRDRNVKVIDSTDIKITIGRVLNLHSDSGFTVGDIIDAVVDEFRFISYDRCNISNVILTDVRSDDGVHFKTTIELTDGPKPIGPGSYTFTIKE